MGLGGRVWESSVRQSSRGELEHKLPLVGHVKAGAAQQEGCAQSRGAQLALEWIIFSGSPLAPAVSFWSNMWAFQWKMSNSQYFWAPTFRARDPTKCWQVLKPHQLLKKHESTSATPPTTGILGDHGADCWTQSCQKSTWAIVTYQKWVSFFLGFPLTAQGFDNQKRWAEKVSAGFLSATLPDGAQHFSGIALLSREGGDWV